MHELTANSGEWKSVWKCDLTLGMNCYHAVKHDAHSQYDGQIFRAKDIKGVNTSMACPLNRESLNRPVRGVYGLPCHHLSVDKQSCMTTECVELCETRKSRGCEYLARSFACMPEYKADNECQAEKIKSSNPSIKDRRYAGECWQGAPTSAMHDCTRSLPCVVHTPVVGQRRVESTGRLFSLSFRVLCSAVSFYDRFLCRCRVQRRLRHQSRVMASLEFHRFGRCGQHCGIRSLVQHLLQNRILTFPVELYIAVGTNRSLQAACWSRTCQQSNHLFLPFRLFGLRCLMCTSRVLSIRALGSAWCAQHRDSHMGMWCQSVVYTVGAHGNITCNHMHMVKSCVSTHDHMSRV